MKNVKLVIIINGVQMSVRNTKFPDKRLRIKAEPVEKFDEYLNTLITDMFETMYHSNGIGLAATQINASKGNSH